MNGRLQGLKTAVVGARMAVAATALTRTLAAQVQARQVQQQPPALRRPGPQVGLQVCSKVMTMACFMPCSWRVAPGSAGTSGSMGATAGSSSDGKGGNSAASSAAAAAAGGSGGSGSAGAAGVHCPFSLSVLFT